VLYIFHCIYRAIKYLGKPERSASREANESSLSLSLARSVPLCLSIDKVYFSGTIVLVATPNGVALK